MRLPRNIKFLLSKAPETKIPEGISPMLATLVDEAFDDPEWYYEVKWDGYRAISYIIENEVKLVSRNNKIFTEKYYPISESLKKWNFNGVLDGEIIVANPKGVSDFGALQNWRSEADGELRMYVFDLLWYDGHNLMKMPLTERQAILKETLPVSSENIRLSEVFAGNGKEFFSVAEKLGLEGIIAKKSNSIYNPGHRTREWLKIKVQKRQEVVIGGYTLNEGGRYFSALLLGLFEKDELKFVGKVGTGFNDKLKQQMLELFRPLIIPSSPFSIAPDVNQPSRFRPDPPRATAVWLKPDLVCEVSFTEMTDEGVFRHPSFKGMRTDKNATDVVIEKESVSEEVLSGKEDKIILKAFTSSENIYRRTLLNPQEESQVKSICGHDLKFTNLSKLYWPEDGVTKRDMINYYYQVAEYIVPYLKDRPQSLNRFPNGINGESFYQKNVKGKSPDWVRRFPYITSDGEHKEFLVGADESTLLWMASLGCIEMNPWFSRIQTDDYPDYCIIDLDPDKNTFEQVIEAALEVREVLNMLGVPSYPKTSGSSGMHIYIPLAAKYTYDQSQMFAKMVVNMVHQRIPDFTSVERYIKNRGGKMYLDHLQNRPGATIASPYSLRPKLGATVSMPLHWDEVKKGLKMKDFTIRNAIERLKITGDLFKGVLGEGIDMEKILESALISRE
jgi:bifunctional non-homologous end joining protein LigD